MKSLMGKKETYFANTLVEAEALVEEQKEQHGDYVKDFSIAKRRKKEVEYFIVTIVIEYLKVSDLVITD